MLMGVGRVGLGVGRVGVSSPGKGGGAIPIGFAFLRVGTPGSSQLVRVGADSASPRILIPTGA